MYLCLVLLIRYIIIQNSLCTVYSDKNNAHLSRILILCYGKKKEKTRRQAENLPITFIYFYFTCSFIVILSSADSCRNIYIYAGYIPTQ